MKVRPVSTNPVIRNAYNPSTQSLIPVVMSGIIAVYGLVVSVLIAGGRKSYHPNTPSRSLIFRPNSSEANRLLAVRRLHTSGRRTGLRLHRTGSWLCYWIRRRLGASLPGPFVMPTSNSYIVCTSLRL